MVDSDMKIVEVNLSKVKKMINIAGQYLQLSYIILKMKDKVAKSKCKDIDLKDINIYSWYNIIQDV